MKKFEMFGLILCCLHGIFVASASAFIPPVGAMLKEVTEGRKSGPVEVVMKHRLQVRGAGAVEIDERVLEERNKLFFIWSGPSFPQPVGASWERYNYIVGDRNIPARSVAMVTYLTANSGDELRDVLTAEQFIRRDQLLQFKPGFNLTGDPETWELRENYLRHADIFLQRLPSGIAYTIVGLEEGNVRKAVFIDRALKGLRKLEWREGQDVHAWNFESFSSFPAGGIFPKRASFDANGTEVITTDIQTVRSPNAKQLGDFKNSWRQAERAALTSQSEGMLKLLLSFR